MVKIAKPDAYYSLDPYNSLRKHSLFRFFAGFDAGFALVQFPSAMLTTEIPAAATAGHEGHLDSVFGFALITLAGTAGFGHRHVSTTGCRRSQDLMSMISTLLQEVASVRHIVNSALRTYRRSSLQFNLDLRWSYESDFLFNGDVSPF